jgi:GPH family glycoside/pentoside/hexuronide:cation symporter
MKQKEYTVSFSQKIFYGFGGAAESIMGGIVFILAMNIYHLEFGLDAGLVGLALLIPRLWDGITDPVMGIISDHTRSRWGRRRPYMFAGSIATGLVCMMMWSPPQTCTQNGFFFYLLGFSVLFFTCYTVFCIPYVAMGFEYTNNYNERTSILAYKVFFTNFINFALMSFAYKLCFFKPFGDTPIQAVRTVGVLYGGFIILFGLVPSIFCRTPEALHVGARPVNSNIMKDMKAAVLNKPLILICLAGFLLVLAAYLVGPLMTFINLSYVCPGNKELNANIGTVVSIIFGISGFIGVPLASFISRKLGKKTTVLLAIGAMILVYGASWFFITPKYPYLQIIYALIVSPSMSTFFVVTGSMAVDTCDYDEYRTGFRREGVFASVSTFITKSSLAVALGINGLMIKYSGFDTDLIEQNTDTALKLRLMYTLIPLILLTISLMLILAYPLSKEKILEIQNCLQARKQNENQ